MAAKSGDTVLFITTSLYGKSCFDSSFFLYIPAYGIALNDYGTLICLQINSHAFVAREKLLLAEFFPLSAIPYGNCEKFTLFRALERLWDAVPHPARDAVSGLCQRRCLWNPAGNSVPCTPNSAFTLSYYKISST